MPLLRHSYIHAAFADPEGTGTSALTGGAVADIRGLVLMNSAGKIIDLAPLTQANTLEPVNTVKSWSEQTQNEIKSEGKSKSVSMSESKGGGKGTKESKDKSWLSASEELLLVSHTQDPSGNYTKKFYPPYSGPGNTILRLFGGGLIAALQVCEFVVLLFMYEGYYVRKNFTL